MIVLIGGEKGGTGKTTLATNLAQMRAARGRDVLLVDTDKQESASAWASLRAEEGIEPTITAVHANSDRSGPWRRRTRKSASDSPGFDVWPRSSQVKTVRIRRIRPARFIMPP